MIDEEVERKIHIAGLVGAILAGFLWLVQAALA